MEASQKMDNWEKWSFFPGPPIDTLPTIYCQKILKNTSRFNPATKFHAIVNK